MMRHRNNNKIFFALESRLSRPPPGPGRVLLDLQGPLSLSLSREKRKNVEVVEGAMKRKKALPMTALYRSYYYY
jgi:hypothetical protein